MKLFPFNFPILKLTFQAMDDLNWRKLGSKTIFDADRGGWMQYWLNSDFSAARGISSAVNSCLKIQFFPSKSAKSSKILFF